MILISESWIALSDCHLPLAQQIKFLKVIRDQVFFMRCCKFLKIHYFSVSGSHGTYKTTEVELSFWSFKSRGFLVGFGFCWFCFVLGFCLFGCFGLCYLESNTHICRPVAKTTAQLLVATGEKHKAFWRILLLE